MKKVCYEGISIISYIIIVNKIVYEYVIDLRDKSDFISALILLLKDPTPTVRSAAAEAMSLLDKY